MDFSPGRLAMLLARGSSEKEKEDSNFKVVVKPSTIKAGRCFVRDFTSKLPYCESTKKEIRNRVLMDDEWILQFEVRFTHIRLIVLRLIDCLFRRRRVCSVGRVISISTAFYR